MRTDLVEVILDDAVASKGRRYALVTHTPRERNRLVDRFYALLRRKYPGQSYIINSSATMITLVEQGCSVKFMCGKDEPSRGLSFDRVYFNEWMHELPEGLVDSLKASVPNGGKWSEGRLVQ